MAKLCSLPAWSLVSPIPPLAMVNSPLAYASHETVIRIQVDYMYIENNRVGSFAPCWWAVSNLKSVQSQISSDTWRKKKWQHQCTFILKSKCSLPVKPELILWVIVSSSSSFTGANRRMFSFYFCGSEDVFLGTRLCEYCPILCIWFSVMLNRSHCWDNASLAIVFMSFVCLRPYRIGP